MKELFAKRLDQQLNAKHLAFTCYRIRRRWSLPLPVTALPELDTQVRGFAQPYPWQIWCLWALEERLYALSGAVSFLDDQSARDRCIEDLEALTQWPRYTVANKLDLPYGHAVQLMAMALRDWTWLPEATQKALQSALQRAVEEGMRNVSTFFQQIGAFFYVTTSGSSRLTGVGTVLKLSGSARTFSAGCPSSGLMHTRAGGLLTTGGPLT